MSPTTKTEPDPASPDARQPARPPLPHERDERTEIPAAPTGEIEQARRDTLTQTDTDNYTRVREAVERAPNGPA